MRFLSLVACTILLICLPLLAQHTSTGSSGSSHASGMSSHSSMASPSGLHPSHGGPVSHGPMAKPGTGSVGKVERDKSSGISLLWHPWRKPAPKPKAVTLRGPICKHGPCVVTCPRGTYSNGKGGCFVPLENACPLGTLWSGSVCSELGRFQVIDCSGLALAAQREAQLAQQLANEQEMACARDLMDAGCTDLTAQSRSEAERYRLLQHQYELCRTQGILSFGYYPLGGYYQLGNLFDVYLDALR